MELGFYLSGLVAVLATVGLISGSSPVHAVVYLIVSLIAVALVWLLHRLAPGHNGKA